MYAIETDIGRFEADTEKDAKKLLRAARRKQDAIDAENARKYEQARLRAFQHAYNVYERKGRGEEMPRGWRIKPVTTTNDSYACREFWSEEKHSRAYRIDGGANGVADVSPYDPITHYLENGSGYCIAVVIANQDSELFAVGVYDGIACWVPLYGVSISEFRQIH